MESSAFFSTLVRRFKAARKLEANGMTLISCAAVIGIFLLASHYGLAADTSAFMMGMVGVSACPAGWRKQAGVAVEIDRGPRLPEWDRTVVERLTNLVLVGREVIGAKCAVGSILDAETGRCFEWETPGAKTGIQRISSVLDQYASGVSPTWSLAAYSRKGSSIRCLVLDQEGRQIHRSLLNQGQLPLRAAGFKSVLLSNFASNERLRGRLAFVDAPLQRGDAAALRGLRRVILLAGLADQWRRSPLNPGAREEREELARDLHDGIAQSLIAAEMNLHTLIRRESSAGIAPAAEAILTDAQQIFRREVQNIRLHIEELRSNQNCQPMTERLSNMVRTFESDTGIQTNFQCDRGALAISGRSAHTLLCLVQEALSNVRKHSGARKVEIQLAMEQQIHLVVRDDGRGLDFSGRLSLSELEFSGRGPRVIRERVRANGGSLIIDSGPNRGVRIELSLPRSTAQPGGAMARAGGRNLPPKIGVGNLAVAKQLDVA